MRRKEAAPFVCGSAATRRYRAAVTDPAAATAVAHFVLPHPVPAVEPHPTGHINDGWLVVAGPRRYLLQRLNQRVFPDADAVMENVVTVTTFLRERREPTLSLVPAQDGGFSWRDDAGSLWRVYDYVEGVTPLEVRSVADAALVGLAFGRFHRLLADLDPARLRVSMPGFHDPPRRLLAFEAAVAEDRDGRRSHASDAIRAVEDLRRVADAAHQLGVLPVRAAHNDAKGENVLVGGDGDRAPLVVDLDTVMPTSVLWDVGDMVRSSSGASEEAATVHFDLERYEALLEAFLSEAGGLLTTAEHAALPVAGVVATYEQAVRFLTDHLLGDVYFRVVQPGQNLARARNQLQLLREMITALGQDGRL